MQVRLTGDSKLTVGVNVSVNGCLCLCVSPVMTWRLVQGVPRLSPVVSWDRLQLACDPVEQDKAARDNEMRFSLIFSLLIHLKVWCTCQSHKEVSVHLQ